MIMETFAILDINTKEKYIDLDIGISPVSCANSGITKPKRKHKEFVRMRRPNKILLIESDDSSELSRKINTQLELLPQYNVIMATTTNDNEAGLITTIVLEYVGEDQSADSSTAKIGLGTR